MLMPADQSEAVWCECGVDVVELDRFTESCDRWGDRLLVRLFTAAEAARGRGQPAFLAARFAAKEAVSKALGTGFNGIGWREIEILSDERGKPHVHLHGAAARRAAELGLTSWSVSLSHSRTLAIAMVVACRAPGARKAQPCAL
jgi:holo-[acyl-carrier protein] synthase